MTDEQYKSEYERVNADMRYSVNLKRWLIDKLNQMYRERNGGKEPPQVESAVKDQD